MSDETPQTESSEDVDAHHRLKRDEKKSPEGAATPRERTEDADDDVEAHKHVSKPTEHKFDATEKHT